MALAERRYNVSLDDVKQMAKPVLRHRVLLNYDGEAAGVRSDVLLDELYEFAFQDRFQYHHEWQVGDLILWDNRCLMHAATADYEGERKLYRISLEGTVPE